MMRITLVGKITADGYVTGVHPPIVTQPATATWLIRHDELHIGETEASGVAVHLYPGDRWYCEDHPEPGTTQRECEHIEAAKKHKEDNND